MKNNVIHIIGFSVKEYDTEVSANVLGFTFDSTEIYFSSNSRTFDEIV